jgi:hypothetical protein
MKKLLTAACVFVTALAAAGEARSDATSPPQGATRSVALGVHAGPFNIPGALICPDQPTLEEVWHVIGDYELQVEGALRFRSSPSYSSQSGFGVAEVA